MASKFWRYVSRDDKSSSPVICELEMFTEANPTVNLCVGGIATASSEWGASWSADKAFNGTKTLNEGWSAIDDPFAWLQYEFVDAVEVDIVDITCGGSGNNVHTPNRFWIQYKDENDEWVTKFAHSTPTWSTLNQTRRFTANVTTQSESVFPIVHMFNGGTPDYAHGEGSFIIPYAYTNFKGDGTISGKLTDNGAPIPGTVTLVHADTQQILKTKETNSLGEYEFTNLRRDFVYDVIAQDLELKWEKRVSSRRAPYASINLGIRAYTGTTAKLEFPHHDPHWNNVVSLMHFDGPDLSTDFTDQTGKVWTRIGGNLTLSDAVSKFGNSSLRMSSSGEQRLSCTHTDFSFGEGDFTIETFYRPDAISNRAVFWFGIRLVYIASSSWAYYNGGNVIVNGTVAANTNFYHVALVRQSGQVKLYVDGISLGTYTDAGNITSDDMNIGYFNSGNPSGGYIDEFRVTKGVARYTENFTPPAEPFLNY